MHLKKCAFGGEAGRCRHNARTCKNHSNEKIDPTKSHLNRNLTRLTNKNDTRTDRERFKDRLQQLSYRHQKNNVRMEEIVITAPKNVPRNDLGKFFLVAHQELQALTGGSENEISSWVHLDETSPHMHYMFVPGIEVNGVLKLSASKLMNRSKLQELHPKMQAAIDKAFGHHEYLVVHDDPDERMQSSDNIKEFKAKKAKLDDLDKEYDARHKYLADKEKALMGQITALQNEIKSGQKKLTAVESELQKANFKLQKADCDLQECLEQLADTKDRSNRANALIDNLINDLSFDNALQDYIDYYGFAPAPGRAEADFYLNWRETDGELINDLQAVQQELNDLEL